MALHPGYRWQWFESTWAHRPAWVKEAKEIVLEVWVKNYKSRNVPPITEEEQSRFDELRNENGKRPISLHFNPFESDTASKKRIAEENNRARAQAVVGDEYEKWCSDDSQKMQVCLNPFAY